MNLLQQKMINIEKWTPKTVKKCENTSLILNSLVFWTIDCWSPQGGIPTGAKKEKEIHWRALRLRGGGGEGLAVSSVLRFSSLSMFFSVCQMPLGILCSASGGPTSTSRASRCCTTACCRGQARKLGDCSVAFCCRVKGAPLRCTSQKSGTHIDRVLDCMA